ncbi:DUF4240 domain-containing protein [Micromonospora sp. NPDC005203]|uniref:DUF4240 domain-containing protein n=1 Tax=Micromonospora sp. NPDC005203 TaxID=3364226 RepID=UPI0036B23997
MAEFQVHLEATRRPIDSYAMWGVANQIMDGRCSGDAFWYSQSWLSGQGQRWWHHAVQDPDNLVPWATARTSTRNQSISPGTATASPRSNNTCRDSRACSPASST